MYTLDDTIAAISTPLGQGGIGIVRLTGDDAFSVASRLFVASSSDWQASTRNEGPSLGREHPTGAETRSKVEPGRLYHGHIAVPETGCHVDEVLLSYMRAPHTYTRQDVVEINAHGGIVPLREILSLCLASGARLAHEGEFTLRAFLNGRLDLAQAEAVLDVICAKTEASLRVAVDQLGGRLSKGVREIRALLLDVLSYIEASIDFSEQDVPYQDVAPMLDHAQRLLDQLLSEVSQGMVYREGVRTVIVGRPNVGKSSLLNALLRTDRAIVTAIPGTTRDTLEETLDLGGIPFVLIDTAGIGETDGLIERLGVERSRRSLQHADLVLFVVDGSVPPTEQDCRVAELLAERLVVVVINKSDLPVVDDYAMVLPQAPHFAVSALMGAGIPGLEQLLEEVVLSGHVMLSDAPVASNPRHRDLFRRALGHVQDAKEAQDRGLPLDMISIDVTEAVAVLGEVTGETVTEDLLANIFGNFCIGK